MYINNKNLKRFFSSVQSSTFIHSEELAATCTHILTLVSVLKPIVYVIGVKGSHILKSSNNETSGAYLKPEHL